MKPELPVSADALLAERARLEEELQSSDDWRELLHLKSRKDRGDNAVNSARLEMVLLDALAEDPAFVRYKAVCVALERLIRGLPNAPPAPRAKPVVVEGDDLTRIKGIDAPLARQLEDLGITTFAQIAEWRSADIKEFSAELGLGRQIYSQNWIDQAARLAERDQDDDRRGAAPAKSAPIVAPRVERQQHVEERATAKVSPPERVFAPASPAPVQAKPRDIAPVVNEAKPQAPTAVVRAALSPVAVQAPPPPPPPPAAPPDAATPLPVAVLKADPLPSAPPPKPLAPTQYGKAAEVEASAPMVAEAETTKPQARPTEAKPEKTAAPPDVSAPLPTPPKPLVVTRASVAALPRQQAPTKPVEPPSAAPASKSPAGASPAKPAPSAPVATPPLPPAVASRTPAPANGSAAPSMSITEAIAYAAEVARQGQRSGGVDNIEARAASTKQPASPASFSKPPVAPAMPQSVVRNGGGPVPVPPPLPAGFATAQPTAAMPRAGNVTSLQLPEGEEHAPQRFQVEEATVEIVRRPSSGAQPPPRIALSTAVKDAVAREPRAATPIGRFLKALTGS